MPGFSALRFDTIALLVLQGGCERTPSSCKKCALIALGLSLPLIGAVGAQVYYGRSSAPESVRPPSGVNDLFKEPALTDLGQWMKKEGAEGEEMFATQTKDGFWANIVVYPEREVWSAEKYASDLLAKLRETDNGTRFITSDMTPEEIKIPEGVYLLVGRFKQRSEFMGLDGLQYWLVIPKGVFNDEVSVLVLTMQNPHSPQEIAYQNQAVQTLQNLSSYKG